MFSLIITLIAIALVAALALATLYYGGPIFNEGADRAQAAKIEAQGQQIMGAMELYHAEKGVYPAALADLVTDEYLKSIPTAAAQQAQMVASALAATGTWSLVTPGQPVIVVKPVSLATCKSFNSVNIGVAGVLKQAHSTKLKQCIGTDVNNLMIIQPKAVSDLLYVAADAGAAVQIGTVLATPIPALSDISANGFLDTTAPTALTYAVSYSTPALAFPDTAMGSTSAAQSVTVTNTGTGALTITGAVASAPFGVSASDCAAVAPGSTCSVSVTFSPTAEQAYSGASYALTLSSPNGILAGLPLTGTGTAAVVPTGPSVIGYFDDNLDPLSLASFGTRAVGSVSGRTEVLVQNITGTPQTVSTVSASGPFIITDNYCDGAALDPDTSCSVFVAFAPTAAQQATGALNVAVASASAAALPLTGTGSQPGVYMTYSGQNTATNDYTTAGRILLGSVQLNGQGYSNATYDLVITNTNATAYTIPGIASFSPNVEIRNDTCGSLLSANSTCTVSVGLSTAGYRNATDWRPSFLGQMVLMNLYPLETGFSNTYLSASFAYTSIP